MISVVAQTFNLAIDLLSSRLAVGARTRYIPAKENEIIVLAVFDHAQAFTHSPLANHFSRYPRRHPDITGCATGNVAKNHFFGYTSAHDHHQSIEQLVLAVVVLFLSWQVHRRPKRRSSRYDRDLVDRIGVVKQFTKQRVTSLMIGCVLFFLFADGQTPTLLTPSHFVAGFFQLRHGDGLEATARRQ